MCVHSSALQTAVQDTCKLQMFVNITLKYDAFSELLLHSDKLKNIQKCSNFYACVAKKNYTKHKVHTSKTVKSL